jgi:CheY-like chemotaxis protein
MPPIALTHAAPILVVDDDPELRETLGELLGEEGYETRLAENGKRALDLLRHGARPSLILLDLMMPEMNGWEFREEQLKDAELRDIPVVVMTASRGVARDALPVQEVLFKPVGLGEIIDAVERNAR